MTNRYATTTLHSLDYYKRLILCVGKCLSVGAKNKAIVDELNNEGILSATGLPFTVERVKQLLKGFRKRLDGPSTAYRAMLELHFQGALTKVQCLPLLNVRAGTM